MDLVRFPIDLEQQRRCCGGLEFHVEIRVFSKIEKSADTGRSRSICAALHSMYVRIELVLQTLQSKWPPLPRFTGHRQFTVKICA